MTLTQLQIFICVAEFRNFTLAAKQLNISQSAVSHALKILEQQWQVTLFAREHHQIQLTCVGERLLQYAKELLNTQNMMQQEIAALRGVQHGILRIGSFGASSSIHLLPELLQAYRQHYPNIEIYVEEGTDYEVAQMILEKRVDVGFSVLPQPKLHTFPLITDIFVALIPNSYPIATQTQIHLTDLKNYPFILTKAGSQTHVEALLKKYQIYPKIKYQLSQILTILNMVNLQEGVSIVADMAITTELLKLHPNVVKRPLMPNTQRHIGLAVRSEKAMSPATQAFITLAQKIFTE